MKKQPPFVSRTPEGPEEDKICAKVSNEDEKSVASKRKWQLNSPNKVSCRKRKKKKTVNEGELAKPKSLISKKELISEKQPLDAGTLSRGKKLLSLAKLKKRPEVSSKGHPPVFNKSSNRTGKTVEDRRKPEVVQELDVSLLAKIKENPIGSGTFGKVFLARYRGMKAVVQEIKMRGASNASESKRCKEECCRC